MIFVTVGTTHFDALVRSVDEAAGQGLIRDDVVIQIGYGGQYVPRHCRYFRVAPTLGPFERAADLIVGHGGTGTTLEILLMRKPLVSVSNPGVSGNHQHEFLEALEALGLVTYCRDLTDLPRMLASPLPSAGLSTGPSRLAADLKHELSRLAPRDRVPAGRLARLVARIGERMARGVEIDVTATLRPQADPPIPIDLVRDPRA